MKEIIQAKIKELEQKENVKFIHAIESGSRAWGFASPDSDYDVRFIYVRPKDFYLRLDKTHDVIEWQLDETLDINGWDLQKALKLLHSSNPTLFEWANSPIIYETSAEWIAIQKEINHYFSQKSGLHHYLNTAKNNYREYLKGETVRLKKYFYVLRPILACKWILQEKCPPPMRFSELCDAVLEPSLKPIVNELLEVKMRTSELGEGKRIDALNHYLEESMLTIQEEINALPNTEKGDWDKLNELFLRTVSS